MFAHEHTETEIFFIVFIYFDILDYFKDMKSLLSSQMMDLALDALSSIGPVPSLVCFKHNNGLKTI